MNPELTVLSADECLALLAASTIGRIAVLDDAGYPAVFPVNYLLVELESGPVLMIRTRPDNVIDRPGDKVAVQLDGVDPAADGGWSVLVRGVLAATEPDPRLDSHPLLAEGRDAWRLIVPTRITGRRLVGDPDRWTFHPLGYL